jgi:hypothetical protein
MTPNPWAVAKDLFFDIRIWILVSLVTHLTAITLPPLDPGISWRETDVLMIARNFYEGSNNIFYPVTDVREDKSGIVGCEFPILNYLIYLLSVPFGYHDWFGRLINLIVSTIGVYCFYRSIKEYFNERVAFSSAVTLLVSYWFLYSRLILPDTFAAGLNLIAIYGALRFFKTEKYRYLILFLICGLFGCLAKISSAVLLTVLAVPIVFDRPSARALVWFVGGSGFIFLGTCAWYFIWVPHLSATYGLVRFFMGMSFSEGIEYVLQEWPSVAKKFYQISMQYSGFVVFVVALIWMMVARRKAALVVFAVPFLAYSIMFLKISYGFAINNYYVVMHLPMMAFVVGYFLGEMKHRKIALVLLMAIVVECIANQIHILNFRESKRPLLGLEAFMDTKADKGSLVAILGDLSGDPTNMYMAHRKGWSLGLWEVHDDVFRQLQSKGCVYYVQVRSIQSDTLALPVLAASNDFILYKLDSTRSIDPAVR